MKLTENGNFCLFAANGKWKRQTSAFFPCKRKMVIDVCCFSKHVHLCFAHIVGTNIFLASFEEKPLCPDHRWAV